MTREHIEHLAAAVGALTLALFISYFNTGAVIHVAPVTHTSASSLTPIVDEANATSSFPGFAFSTTTAIADGIFPIVPSAGTQEKAPPKEEVPAPTPATPSSPVAPTPAQAPTPTQPTAPAAPATTTPTSSVPAQTSALAQLKPAIVNIICTSREGTLRGVSGSGVVIDSRGIILTVSHVAQMIVLADYLDDGKITCIVRNGTPAKNAYIAKPIYVSEAWLKANPTTLISSQPTGTGEHDFALLAITGSAGEPLTGAYPAVALSTATAKVGSTVYLGSYGAQDLTTAQVKNSLSPTLTQSSVTDRYTFGGNTVDVLALAGNAAAQEGSSGGAVVNADGELMGIITTSEITGPVSERSMRIITTSYIERDFESATGKNFDTYFSDTSLTTLVAAYAPTVQTLGQFLANAIGLQ